MDNELILDSHHRVLGLSSEKVMLLLTDDVYVSEKQSKRVPARRRYKIEKRVRQHNKKKRREDKKKPQGEVHFLVISVFDG